MRTAMVNTSEGCPPQHQTQMKLFNAIAAAAVVIAGSLVTANPSKAGCYPALAASKMETMLHAGLSHEEAFNYAASKGLIDSRSCALELRGDVIQHKSSYPKTASPLL